MRIVEKFDITDALLTASNVSETDETEWTAAGAPYAASTIRMVTSTDDGAAIATHKIYKSTAGTNNEDPTLRTTYLDGDNKPVFWWEEISSTNRFKMFDDIPQDQTENADNITGTLELGRIVTAIAFINVDAENITVTVTDPVDGVVYNETENMQDYSGIFDYFEYFFSPILRRTEVVFYDLPPYSTAEIDFDIDFTGSTAKCGALVVGDYFELGESEYGFQFGIKDFSQPVEDALGRITFGREGFARTFDVPFVIEKGRERSVQRVLSNVLNKATVFDVRTDDDAGIVFGYYADFRVTYRTQAFTNGVIRIRGLVE
jgi:hypothetical protein